ncbi:tetratricopeptide repeat protein [Psychrobacter lutiphocae]|uniref:tetratricopeptide repeat protein n=1 Tax=Psychrobacter lutiphocae TaxID=540500 RepID=UPI00036BE9FB|nr:tetratricopeptide repeat protein [Psychrobacter lutiphocae]
MKNRNIEIKNTVKKITNLFKNNNFDMGYELLKNSNLPDVAFLECEGNAEFYKKNYSAAFDFYNQAYEKDSNYKISRYYYLWASDFLNKNDLVQAFQYYQESIEIEPDFVDAYIDLGALLIDIGELESAKKCYEDALAIDPQDQLIRKSLDSLKAIIKN